MPPGVRRFRKSHVRVDYFDSIVGVLKHCAWQFPEGLPVLAAHDVPKPLAEVPAAGTVPLLATASLEATAGSPSRLPKRTQAPAPKQTIMWP